MVKRSSVLLIVIIAIVMVLGIGFAAITATQLNITGNTTATPDQANFKVKFLEQTVVSEPSKVTAQVTGDTTATINVQGLTAKGDKVTATYKVKNFSADLSADIALSIGNNNEEYFSTTAVLGQDSLKADEETTVVVTVELTKTPIQNDETAKITAIIEATPVQPGEEGTSGALPPSLSASASELFDPEGTNPDGLHIGDFVNYDAGIWTEEEINSIQTGPKTSLVTANGNATLPSTAFQFGGFTVGSSRNENAVSYSVNYNYVKNAETGEAITGWRVFDIEGDTVTLISAGNPEDYCHQYGTNYGYISEYILTGNINSSWSEGTDEAEKYQKRNWDMYVNKSQYGKSATALTKTMLDAWYTKYTGTVNADIETQSIFQKIYQEPYIKYQNMIENYSFYSLFSARYNNYVYFVDPSYRVVYGGNDSAYAFGVRAIVTLTPNVKFNAVKVGTKTVIGGNMDTYGGDQTYNVWELY